MSHNPLPVGSVPKLASLFPAGLLAAVCITTGSVAAQEVSGAIEGRLVDSSAAPLSGAQVVVSSPSLQGTRSTRSDDAGRFRLVALPVGAYRLEIRRIGYRATVVEEVPVRLGKTTVVGPLTVPVQALELEPLVVRADRVVIDPTSTTVGENLTADDYASLPTGRNYRAITLLLPHANESFLGDPVNIGGATGLENVYFIDGVNVTDPYRARTGADLPYHFVEEIQVKQGGYQAEFGKALGGIVNVVTPSGGDEFRAEAFGFFTNSALATDARRGVADARVEAFRTYDVGFSVSGPIAREKLWFYGAYDPAFEREDVGIPGLDFQEQRLTKHQFAGKLTWRASQNTDLVFTALGDPTSRQPIGTNAPIGTPTALESPDPFLSSVDEGGYTLSLKSHTRLSSRLALDVALSRYSRDEDRSGATEQARTEPVFMDLTTGIWSGGFGTRADRHSVRSAAKVDATLFAGPHTLKAGVEYEENFIDFLFVSTPPGVIQKVDSSTFVSLIFVTDGEARNRVPAAYVQDSWRATERLILNAGVRWSGQFLIGDDGSVAQGFPDQWQPRVGFTYQPGALGTQKIFGSFGRFYLQFPLHLAQLEFIPFDNFIDTYTEDPRNPGAEPVDRQVFSTADGPPQGSEVKGAEGEHMDEFTLGYERALGEHTSVRVRGIYRTLRNAFIVGLDPETGLFTLGNPGEDRMSFLPEVERDYTALEISLRRSGGERFDLLASYVLSRTHGNYTGQFTSDTRFAGPGNNFALQMIEQAKNSTGLLPNDRPHVFKLSGAYRFPFGLSAGAVFTVMSGTPLNEFGATSLVFRPAFLVPRGSAGRTGTLWDLNLRFTYDLSDRLFEQLAGRIVLDLEHVGSPRKATALDQFRFQALDENGEQTAPNPTFGEPLFHQPPMSLRLGVEFGIR